MLLLLGVLPRLEGFVVQEVLEDSDVVWIVELSIQLDLFVAEDTAEFVLLWLRFVPALRLVLAEELKAAEFLQVIEIQGLLLGLEKSIACLTFTGWFEDLRPLQVLPCVRHEEIALSGEDVGVANDYLSGHRKEVVVLEERTNRESAPTFGVTTQETQGFVVAEVEGQALRHNLRIIAVESYLDRHSCWLSIDQIVQSSHWDLQTFVFFAFRKVQLDLLNMLPKDISKLNEALLLFGFSEFVSTPF